MRRVFFARADSPSPAIGWQKRARPRSLPLPFPCPPPNEEFLSGRDSRFIVENRNLVLLQFITFCQDPLPGRPYYYVNQIRGISGVRTLLFTAPVNGENRCPPPGNPSQTAAAAAAATVFPRRILIPEIFTSFFLCEGSGTFQVIFFANGKYS